MISGGLSKQIRGQLTIFVFLPTADENTEMKGSLVESGYESFVFMDQDLLIERVKQVPPHLILFSPDALMTPLSEFVQKVLEINSEIQFICAAPLDQTEPLLAYREYNFAAVVPSGVSFVSRAMWTIDVICDGLYRFYQNEELLSQIEKNHDEAEAYKKKTQHELNQLKLNQTLTKETSIAIRLAAYAGCQSKEEYLAVFLKQIPVKTIFFKFLPTVSSFVATAAEGMEIEDMKGVGSRLTPDESRDVVDFMTSGRLPTSLQELMKDGLRIDSYFSKPLLLQNNVEGLFVFWSPGHPASNFESIQDDFLLFQILYQQAYLAKRNENLDVFDSTTELFNKTQFYKKLDEEIARARRLERPISVVRLTIDNLDFVDQQFGRNNRDLILRTIASIIKKTSRVNDYACRTEDKEFSLILPHSGRKGAALRAERLRRIIESHTFAISDLKVTISCGVSEYPTLATGASDLDVSAGKALEFILARGGNKVCLYKPSQEFKPDFNVPSN